MAEPLPCSRPGCRRKTAARVNILARWLAVSEVAGSHLGSTAEVSLLGAVALRAGAANECRHSRARLMAWSAIGSTNTFARALGALVEDGWVVRLSEPREDLVLALGDDFLSLEDWIAEEGCTGIDSATRAGIDSATRAGRKTATRAGIDSATQGMRTSKENVNPHPTGLPSVAPHKTNAGGVAGAREDEDGGFLIDFNAWTAHVRAFDPPDAGPRFGARAPGVLEAFREWALDMSNPTPRALRRAWASWEAPASTWHGGF